MRLPRTSLLNRITDVDAPAFVLMEAPTGFGKSWLLRKAAPAGALRLRGELGPIADASFEPATAIVIDDAHLLGADEIDRLVQHVEDAPPSMRLIVSGRILPDAVHHVAHLVDGLVLDWSGLSISADELKAEGAELDPIDAAQLIETTDGCVKLLASAIDQCRQDSRSDPVAIATQLLRMATAASLQELGDDDVGLVNLLARAPGVDRTLLLRLGGPGFVDRVLAAGVPLRRHVSGAFDVIGHQAYKLAEIDSSVAARMATALIERDRPIEAVNLLLDARAHDRAARLLIEVPESFVRTVAPRALLALLARLGTMTENEPALLLMRATASSVIGRGDSAAADIDKAMTLVSGKEGPIRRRVGVEAAEWLLLQGHRDAAVEAAASALDSLGPGEDRTYARANMVLADAASQSDTRADLLRAAEWYREASAAWDGCGESAKARLCRCLLAVAVLVPLGRFDEALALLGQVLKVAELTDPERAWTLCNEGFALASANRLDSAESRFDRVADLGYIQDNPRLIATAAWGRAIIASRRDDLDATIRWVATAENTALGPEDDVLGVVFHCDIAVTLGAMGEFELARRHLQKAKERPALFEHHVQFASYVHAARCGEVDDIEAQLAVTTPSERWRVELVSALAVANSGQFEKAEQLLTNAERELVALGFSDFAGLGERRTYEQLQALLARAERASIDQDVSVELSIAVDPASSSRTLPVGGRRLRVVGGPMLIEDADGVVELPPGNPQRLVGVVVANGGIASLDHLSEAMWPGDDVDASRARLRNVLLRVRRGAGNLVVRSGSGIRLASGIACDLYEFDQLATDALASARTDPDVAGAFARQALKLVDGPIFGDFEYEDWAVNARRAAEQQLIGLLDLLSVQAEDDGDLTMAQSLAERALRLDRYSDSRYLRLAELLTLQGRTAAAAAVLEDAASASRELVGSVPPAVKARRDEIMRRAANG